ncbi:MAG: 2-oxo acid dehydrogenase subunit E2, partial [Myxococcales bacterium]|nr:2-oxo acid dehydrogenase subunit E2 [Myxococcales bacterium]
RSGQEAYMSIWNVDVEPLKKTPAFRQLALGTWDAPRNPEIYGILEVDLTKAQEWAAANAVDGVKITPLHMVSKALGMAMERYPDLNGYVRFGRIYLRKSVDIFFQVMTPGENGRTDLTGVRIAQINRKSVHEIATEMATHVKRAREKKDLDVQKTASMMKLFPSFIVRWLLNLVAFISYTLNIRFPGIPKDPFGGAMVSNIGALGLDTAFAPLVPYSRTPVVILLGQAKPRAVVVDGTVQVRNVIRLNSTIDHRFCDGALLAKMVKVVHDAFENPDEYFGRPTASAAKPSAESDSNVADAA